MLNLFPELMTFSLLGPAILRIVLGLIFLDLGMLKFKGERTRWIASFEALRLRPADLMVSIYAALQVIGGLMLIFGLWTQAAALAFTLFTGAELYTEWKAREMLKRDLVFYILVFAISLSLLLTGAGAFAVDLPL
jgi:uncharacterized membrane protein YphA (DoxX/SURF4 family)